jgi:hypothetical protein
MGYCAGTEIDFLDFVNVQKGQRDGKLCDIAAVSIGSANYSKFFYADKQTNSTRLDKAV